MTRYAVGLGSNQDDRLRHMMAGVSALSGVGEIVAVSPLYETEPVGGPDQKEYLNAIVVVESDLAPEDLLSALHEIEDQRNRMRNVRWGPRTLDLDIVSSDLEPIESEILTVPHVESANRRFVLQPLADVWPEAPVAGGISAGEALFGLVGQEVELIARHWVEYG